MVQRALSWAKSHPYLTLGIVVLGVLIGYAMTRGGSSNAVGTVEYVPNNSNVAAASQVQAAQVAANAQASQDEKALQALELQTNAALEAAKLASNVELERIAAERSVAKQKQRVEKRNTMLEARIAKQHERDTANIERRRLANARRETRLAAHATNVATRVKAKAIKQLGRQHTDNTTQFGGSFGPISFGYNG